MNFDASTIEAVRCSLVSIRQSLSEFHRSSASEAEISNQRSHSAFRLRIWLSLGIVNTTTEVSETRGPCPVLERERKGERERECYSRTPITRRARQEGRRSAAHYSDCGSGQMNARQESEPDFRIPKYVFNNKQNAGHSQAHITVINVGSATLPANRPRQNWLSTAVCPAVTGHGCSPCCSGRVSRPDLAILAADLCLSLVAPARIRLTLAIMNYGNNTHSAVIND